MWVRSWWLLSFWFGGNAGVDFGGGWVLVVWAWWFVRWVRRVVWQWVCVGQVCCAVGRLRLLLV